jgi:hypothetical protein
MLLVMSCAGVVFENVSVERAMATRVVGGLCVRFVVAGEDEDGELERDGEGAEGGGIETMCAEPEDVRCVSRGLFGSFSSAGDVVVEKARKSWEEKVGGRKCVGMEDQGVVLECRAGRLGWVDSIVVVASALRGFEDAGCARRGGDA